ncbi:MAG: hypothetical protein AB1679_17415 [Actinomycetota bacterium]|jgi:uncharacterized delta-60 repeat protein
MDGAAQRVAPRRRWFLCLLVSLVAALTPLAGSDPASSVQGPHVDESFGTGGIAFVDGALADETAVGLVLRPDGGALVVGDAGEGPTDGYGRLAARPALFAHFDERGALDPARPTTNADPGDGGAGGMEIQVVLAQPDGKLLLGGVEGHGPIVRRVDQDGRPDPSFGDGGRRGIYRERLGAGVVLAMALQPDGAVVLAGRTAPYGRADQPGEQELWVARLTPDGAMDPTFGRHGSVTIDLFDTEDFAFEDQEESTIPFAVGVLPGGRIVVAGVTDSSYGTAQIFLGFTPAGQVDRRFGDEGLQLGPVGEFIEIPAALTVQTDGRFIVTGTRVDGRGVDLFVRRHLPTGAVDGSFAGGGAVLGAADRSEIGLGIGLDPQGRVVVAGSAAGTGDGATADVLVARLRPDGTVDAAFGGLHHSPAGFMLLDTGGRDRDEASAVAVDAAGRIVLAATSTPGDGADLALVRLSPDGIPDPSLGGDGVVVADVYEDYDHWSGVAVMPDGAVLAAGRTVDRRPGSVLAGVVSRLAADGRPDPGFGGRGRTDVSPHPSHDRDVAAAPDGSVVAAGLERRDGAELGVVRRFKPDGSPDPTFGVDGTVFGPGGSAGANGRLPGPRVDAVAVQADQRVLLAGPAGGGDGIAVVRLQPDGSVDPDFAGGAGFTLLDRSASDAALAVAADGDIVMLTVQPGLSRFIRLESDGTRDQGFGENGEVLLGAGSSLELQDMTVQPDGKIVAAGSQRTETGAVRAVAVRLTDTGLLDPTFGCNGGVVIAPDTAAAMRGVAIDGLGRVVLGGIFEAEETGQGGAGERGVLAARLRKDGSLDAGFGDGGMVKTPLAGSELDVTGAGVDGQGRPVVAGTVTRPGRSSDGFAIRYLPGTETSSQLDLQGLIDCAVTQVSKLAAPLVRIPSLASAVAPVTPAEEGVGSPRPATSKVAAPLVRITLPASAAARVTPARPAPTVARLPPGSARHPSATARRDLLGTLLGKATDTPPTGWNPSGLSLIRRSHAAAPTE